MKKIISIILIFAVLVSCFVCISVTAETTRNILITEDFEGSSPKFVGAQATLMPKSESSGSNTGGKGCENNGGEGSSESTENVNHYIDLYKTTAADYVGKEYGWSSQVYVDSLPDNFMLTADIYKEEDNTNPFIFSYFTDDKDGDGRSDCHGQMVLSPDDVEAGKWYTYTARKVGGTGALGVFNATLVDKETGVETKPIVLRNNEVSSASAINRFFFRTVNLAGETSHWRIDNVTVEENFDFELPSRITTVDTYYPWCDVEVDGITWTIVDAVKGTVDDKTTDDKTDDEIIDAVVTPTGYVNEDGNIVATTKDGINLKTNVPYGLYLYSMKNNQEGNPFRQENFTANHDLEMRLRYDSTMKIMYYTGTHRFFLSFASDSMLVCNDKNNNQLPVEADFGGFNQWFDLKLSVRDTKWGTISINGKELMTFEMPAAPGRIPHVQYAAYKTDVELNMEIDSVRLTSYDSDALYFDSVKHYDTVEIGSDVILSTNTDAAKIFVNGVEIGTENGKGIVLSAIKEGVYDIWAEKDEVKSVPIRIFAKNENVEKESATELSNSESEYILEYEYDGSSDNNICVNDGYFTFDFSHNGNSIAYRNDKSDSAVYTGAGNGIGAGKYKAVVTSGYAEVYYNGHFLFSTFLPYTYNENSAQSFEYRGLQNVSKSPSGVKLQRYHKNWCEDEEFVDYDMNFGRFYSVEFDKLDASYETFIVYDGEYQAKITFDEKGIRAESQREDFDVTEDYSMDDVVEPGYYRLTVAKGVAQLFRNNRYVDSFRCPAVNHRQSVFRKMDNPASSTFVAIKNTDDIYFHSEDFEGGREFEPEDYFFSEQEGYVLVEDAEDPFTQEIVTEGGNSYLKISDKGLESYITTTEYDAPPIGDYNLNVSADNPDIKWSAKADGNGEIHFIARYVQKAVFLSFAYNFENSEWRLYKYNRTKAGDGNVHDMREILTANSGSLDNSWHEYQFVMNDGDVELLCDGQSVLSYSGLLNAHGRVGFGVSDGAALAIDNIVYSGEGKVSPGISYISQSGGDSKDFFYHPKYDGVIAANTRKPSFLTRDGGETWEAIDTGFQMQLLNTLNGNFMMTGYGSSGWNIYRTFSAFYPAKAVENWGSGNHMINGRWGQSNLLIEPEWYDTAGFSRVMLPSRLTQVQDGKYKGRIFMTRNICVGEEYGGTVIFYTDFDNTYNPDDTSYYDGTTQKVSSAKLHHIEWTQCDELFSYENVGINNQESQIVDMPNDVIRYFVRTDSGFIEYADSFDGGATFNSFRPSQLIAPLCTFNVVRDPQNLDHYYAFYQYDANTSDKSANGGRPRTRAVLAVSYDAMENWHLVADMEELSDDWAQSYTPMNHGMKVIDGTVYMSYGVGTGYSKIYAADIAKAKPLLRYSEVHDKVDKYTNNARLIENQVSVLPKTDGTGSIYGHLQNITVTDKHYTGAVIGKIFGATEKNTGIFDFFGTEIAITADENGNYDICDAAMAFSKSLTETENAYIISNTVYDRVITYQLENMGIEKTCEQEMKSDFLNLLNTASFYNRKDNLIRHIDENSEYLDVSLETVDDAVYEKLIGLEFCDIEDVENTLKSAMNPKTLGNVFVSTVGNGFDGWYELSTDGALEISTSKSEAKIKSNGLCGPGNFYGIASDIPVGDYNVEFSVKPEKGADMFLNWGNSTHSVNIALLTQDKEVSLGTEKIIISPDIWTQFNVFVDDGTVTVAYQAEGGEMQTVTFEKTAEANKRGFWTMVPEIGCVNVKDVRVYTGVSEAFGAGVVCIEKEEVPIPTYEGNNNLARYEYTQNPEAPRSAGYNGLMTVIFDANNTVAGMPLSIHISGGEEDAVGNYVGTVAIPGTGEDVGQWYTYKIVARQIFGKKDMDILNVYRKKSDSDETFEKCDFIENAGGRISSGVGNIRFGYRSNTEVYAVSGTNSIDTKWKVRNLKVIAEDSEICGYLTNDGKNITAELEFISPDMEATPILAVYDSGRFVGEDGKSVINGEGNVLLNVPVEEKNGKTVKIFIWKNVESGVPYSKAIIYDY